MNEHHATDPINILDDFDRWYQDLDSKHQLAVLTYAHEVWHGYGEGHSIKKILDATMGMIEAGILVWRYPTREKVSISFDQ